MQSTVERTERSQSRTAIWWQKIKSTSLVALRWLFRITWYIICRFNPIALLRCLRRSRDWSADVISSSAVFQFADICSTDFINRKLLQWIKDKLTAGHFHGPIPTDLGPSWRDGIALCALINSLCPGTCPDFANLKTYHRVKNCRLALQLAQLHLQVPQNMFNADELASYGEFQEFKVRCLLLMIQKSAGKLRPKLQRQRQQLLKQQSQPQTQQQNQQQEDEKQQNEKLSKKSSPKGSFCSQSEQDQLNQDGSPSLKSLKQVSSKWATVAAKAAQAERNEKLEGLVGKPCRMELCLPTWMDPDELTADVKVVSDASTSGQDAQPTSAPDNTVVDIQPTGEGVDGLNDVACVDLSFVPCRPGKHLVYVRWRGDDVTGSPFTVSVSDVHRELLAAATAPRRRVTFSDAVNTVLIQCKQARRTSINKSDEFRNLAVVANTLYGVTAAVLSRTSKVQRSLNITGKAVDLMTSGNAKVKRRRIIQQVVAMGDGVEQQVVLVNGCPSLSRQSSAVSADDAATLRQKSLDDEESSIDNPSVASSNTVSEGQQLNDANGSLRRLSEGESSIKTETDPVNEVHTAAATKEATGNDCQAAAITNSVQQNDGKTSSLLTSSELGDGLRADEMRSADVTSTGLTSTFSNETSRPSTERRSEKTIEANDQSETTLMSQSSVEKRQEEPRCRFDGQLDSQLNELAAERTSDCLRDGAPSIDDQKRTQQTTSVAFTPAGYDVSNSTSFITSDIKPENITESLLKLTDVVLPTDLTFPSSVLQPKRNSRRSRGEVDRRSSLDIPPTVSNAESPLLIRRSSLIRQDAFDRWALARSAYLRSRLSLTKPTTTGSCLPPPPPSCYVRDPIRNQSEDDDSDDRSSSSSVPVLMRSPLFDALLRYVTLQKQNETDIQSQLTSTKMGSQELAESPINDVTTQCNTSDDKFLASLDQQAVGEQRQTFVPSTDDFHNKPPNKRKTYALFQEAAVQTSLVTSLDVPVDNFRPLSNRHHRDQRDRLDDMLGSFPVSRPPWAAPDILVDQSTQCNYDDIRAETGACPRRPPFPAPRLSPGHYLTGSGLQSRERQSPSPTYWDCSRSAPSSPHERYRTAKNSFTSSTSVDSTTSSNNGLAVHRRSRPRRERRTGNEESTACRSQQQQLLTLTTNVKRNDNGFVETLFRCCELQPENSNATMSGGAIEIRQKVKVSITGAVKRRESSVCRILRSYDSNDNTSDDVDRQLAIDDRINHNHLQLPSNTLENSLSNFNF